MSIGRAFRLVAIVLGAITLVLATVDVVVVVRTRDFLVESITSPGQVVALEPRESCSTREDERGQERETCGTVYAPRVRYTTADGREIVFVSGTASNPSSYAEGDRVEVRYRPERPAQAQVDSVGETWLAAIVLGADHPGLRRPHGPVGGARRPVPPGVTLGAGCSVSCAPPGLSSAQP